MWGPIKASHSDDPAKGGDNYQFYPLSPWSPSTMSSRWGSWHWIWSWETCVWVSEPPLLAVLLVKSPDLSDLWSFACITDGNINDDGSTWESCSEAFENDEILCKCTVIPLIINFGALLSRSEQSGQHAKLWQCGRLTVSFLSPPRTAAGNGKPGRCHLRMWTPLQPAGCLSRVHSGRSKYSWRRRSLRPASALFWSSPK